MKIGDNEYTLREEEFYLVHEDAFHSFTADRITGLVTIEVKFTVGNKQLSSKLKNIDECFKFSDPRVRYLLESLIIEGISKVVYYNDIVNIKLLEIIIYLLRMSESAASVINNLMQINFHDMIEIKGRVGPEDFTPSLSRNRT